jgi:GT2 family glycosyltransferase
MTRLAQLSVAISTRNRPEALERCLWSLARGSAWPAEVIVVDQSSGEATGLIVDRFQREPFHIVYLRQEPMGLAVSQNTAVARAKYPVIAVIDDDCVADGKWLATIEQAFASDKDLAALAGRVLPQDPEGDRVYPVSSRTSTVRRDFRGKTVPWPVGSGNNFAVRWEWFKRVGGCDERLGPGSPAKGGMDMDLFYRLLRVGAVIRYEPEALVYHERQTRSGRMERRPMYGHGMGACCALRLREGDAYALWLLARWLFFRAHLAVRALLHRHWVSVYEECLMLGSSLEGLIHGFTMGRSTSSPSRLSAPAEESTSRQSPIP